MLKRRFLIMLAVVMIISIFTGCGSASVKNNQTTKNDFFILAASGTSDFAYHAFKAQIMAMAQDSDGMFKFANNETDGNLSFLEREGYEHDQKACDEYTYNGLRFFWNEQ